jgi:hypothetical protein
MARFQEEFLKTEVEVGNRLENEVVAVAKGQHLTAVGVGPPGHDLRVVWTAVSGATGAEVTQANLSINPSETEETLGDLPVKIDSAKLFAEVSVSGGKRIKALNLQNLKDSTGALLASSSDIHAKGLRLVVTVLNAGQFGPPLYAVPPCPKRGMVPPALAGASYTNGTLQFDQPLNSAKIRLALARNDFPESFAPDPISLGKVSGVAAVTPRDLTLKDPSGGTVWAFPGEMPADLPPTSADLHLALEKAIKDALPGGKPLDFTFKLGAANSSKAGASFSGASGFLLREYPGVLKSNLEGDPQTAPLGGLPLASEAPFSATADLTVHYQGMRILETVSDSLPGADKPVGGVVVGSQPVLRTFPPAAFGSLPVVRIGLVGRAPEATELVVQLVDLSAGGGSRGSAGQLISKSPPLPAAPLPAGVKRVDPGAVVHIEWIDLPQFSPPSGPLGLAVHTNQGRFFWACRAGASVQDQPLVLVAVLDPDPGGRLLKLAGRQVISIDQDELHQVGFSLPTAAFKSGGPGTPGFPAWESSLFLKLEMSDLVLRYKR